MQALKGRFSFLGKPLFDVLEITWRLWYLKEATKALKHNPDGYRDTQKNFISVFKKPEKLNS